MWPVESQQYSLERYDQTNNLPRQVVQNVGAIPFSKKRWAKLLLEEAAQEVLETDSS